MRVVTEIRPWIRTAGVGPIICDVDPVDVPRAGGVRCLRHRDVEMVDESERPVWTRLQCQRNKEEALRRRVVVARRVGDELAANTGGAVDRRRIAVERVEIDGVVHVPRKPGDDVGGGVVRKLRLAGRVEDVHHVVHGFDNVAVADTQTLVRRLEGELVATTRVALLVEVEPLEARVQHWVRLGLLRARDRGAAARAARQAAVDAAAVPGDVSAVVGHSGKLGRADLAVRRNELARRWSSGAPAHDLADVTAGRADDAGADGERRDDRDGHEWNDPDAMEAHAIPPTHIAAAFEGQSEALNSPNPKPGQLSKAPVAGQYMLLMLWPAPKRAVSVRAGITDTVSAAIAKRSSVQSPSGEGRIVRSASRWARLDSGLPVPTTASG